MEAFLHLMRTSTELTEAFDALHASHNISHGRFIVLMLLNRDPEKPVNPADLADRANVTRATMTGLIDTLERDGFVKREHTSGRPPHDAGAADGRRAGLFRRNPA